MSKTQFEHLFTPLQVGPMRVPNRIVETTNSIWASRSGGFIDDAFIAHHVGKARGGTGWIGGETWILNSPLPPEAPDEFLLRRVSFTTRGALYQAPGFVEGAARFCDEVHRAGAVAVFQFSQFSCALAASSVPVSETNDFVPHAMTEDEIDAYINIYADAAAVAKEAGADGIEVHCSHDSLPQNFLSPALNLRTDRWGGGPAERVRFVVETLERVRKRVGTSLALGIRLNGQEFRQGGYGHLEMREMTYAIGETGLLDYVSLDVGHSWGPHSYVPPSFYSPGEYREVGKAARADLDSSIKVLFAGRINDPVVAEELLKGNYCDLVGMARAGIADPEFANKAREGRLLEIRRCIACNRCIQEANDSDRPDSLVRPTCSVNPVVGNELEWQANFHPAERPKCVVVVGGGVAGCEAARVAAMRGHKVVLFEQGKRLGGQLLIAAKAPGRDSFEDQVYFEENALARLGVEVRLETCADSDTIRALAPEAVVIATGARPRVPENIPGIGLGHVVQGWDVLLGRADTGVRVALVSQEDGFETLNVAEYLAERGRHVTIFHKSPSVGLTTGRYSMGAVLSRLEQREIQVYPNRRLAEVRSDGLTFVSSFGGKTYQAEGFDTVVLVYGAVPDAALYEQLRAEGAIGSLYIAGAAWTPRRIAEATQHGASIGLVI
ncbi:MAG: FAD-dependent oxidoreductase [Gammaproteobacteria bacterium]|nr:MAG: FAD-dependent oxidoreductase [Gammaproteobacteria bacterium]